ncbi:conserved hypothetical protein [Gammaproteobacteria bacterium]
MTSLLTIAECKALVRSSVSDTDLQVVIDRVEGMITNKIGAYQDDSGAVTITKTVKGGGERLFLPVAFSEIISITEDDDLLDSDDYRAWGDQGMAERLPDGAVFGTVCVVVFKPVDQRNERKQATIDLVRLFVERTAMVSENVAGEYSFSAPEWDKDIKRAIKNLCFTEV